MYRRAIDHARARPSVSNKEASGLDVLVLAHVFLKEHGKAPTLSAGHDPHG